MTRCFSEGHFGPGQLDHRHFGNIRGEGYLTSSPKYTFPGLLWEAASASDYVEYNSCGSGFHCNNDKCINHELTCDNVDHCGDFSDELAVGAANCGQQDVIAVHKADHVDNITVDNPLTESIMKLGVVATVTMTAGSVIVAVVCVACFICCCCRCLQKRNLHDTSSDMCNHATTATSVTINNGGPHMPMGHSLYQHSTPCAPPHTGYYPMHQVASSQSSHHGVSYSPFRTPNQRESFSHVGSTYSPAPPSYHRSVTPTSSRSGRSHHSHHSNDGSVKFAQCDRDRVSMPVHL
ncbi:hypothetical protein LSAT2_008148 [Lamellibrachia satsuma]|nr:hypothetical protein LSAT2_008148 [Lamellibrachia satsuma]